MFTHVLLPTDGSELSQAANLKGVLFAKEANAQITGVSVIPEFHVLTFNTTMLEDTKDQFLAESRAQATKNLAMLQKAAAAEG
ncbi:MAG TPA: universal stress protein, partial [Caldimonas sp.]